MTQLSIRNQDMRMTAYETTLRRRPAFGMIANRDQITQNFTTCVRLQIPMSFSIWA